MKFTDYEASFITPQMTLLEKFNALCKFLETEYSSVYKHTLEFNEFKLVFYNNSSKNNYTISDLNNVDFLRNQINAHIIYAGGLGNILQAGLNGSKMQYKYYFYNELAVIEFDDTDVIISQECEKL